MLSQQTKDLVKVTTPLFKQHGEAIAIKMYKLLFKNYPQVKPLFVKAPPNQAQILARTMITYCENIDNLSVLDGVFDTISRRHFSNKVQPEHFPMVGDSLLKAMKAVLKESVTDEILEAWQEAYEFLAKLLIERQQQWVKR